MEGQISKDGALCGQKINVAIRRAKDNFYFFFHINPKNYCEPI